LQGVLVTLAIGFHNIPEGLAVATVLVARGVSAKSALTWCAVEAAYRMCSAALMSVGSASMA
jgi:zinc transporter ZupT